MLKQLVLFSSVFFTTLSANAMYIVDTGPGPTDIDLATTVSARYASDQFIGFQLVLDKKTNITGIEGWISVIPGGAGTGIVSLYSDASGLPGGSLFSGDFYAPITSPIEDFYQSQWLGATNLDWSISSGTYWVTFESAERNDGGLVAGFFGSSSNPIGPEIYKPGGYNSGHPWYRNDDLDFGFRVSDNRDNADDEDYSDDHDRPTKIPEPATFLLMGIGIAGLGFVRRKKSA